MDRKWEPLVEYLEGRRLLALISDSNRLSMPNQTLATAQGPVAIDSKTTASVRKTRKRTQSAASVSELA